MTDVAHQMRQEAAPRVRADSRRAAAPLRQVVPDTRVSFAWGSGRDGVGKRHDPESAGEGPMSFVVGRDGTVYVLDQVNGRIVRRKKDGSLLAPIALRGITAQDLRVDDHGGVAVLDRLGDKSLQRYDADGKEVGSKTLASIGVRDPGGATGLFDDDDGALYVEESLRGEAKRVLHPESGGPDLVGRPSRNGRQLVAAAITSRNEGQLVARSFDPTGALTWETPLAVPPLIIGIVLCETDGAGNLYIGVLHAAPSGADLIGEQLDIFRLDPAGNVTAAVSVPHPPSTLEQFRELSVAADGTVYWLHAAANGSGMVLDALPL